MQGDTQNQWDGGWVANLSEPLVRLYGFDGLALRLNVVYNTHYRHSHVFYMAGESRLAFNFSLPYLPPHPLFLQVPNPYALNHIP